MLLYSARVPSGETDSETRPRVCGGGNSAFGGWRWPDEEAHCFIAPSAETETTLSEAVQAAPQTASECAGVELHEHFWFYRRIRVRIRSEQSWACRNARLCTDVSIQKTPRKLTYHCS